MTDKSVLSEVLDAIGLGERDAKSEKIPRLKVQHWMKSDDLEVMGAVFALVNDRRLSRRVIPPLNFDESFDFALKYYQRCILENPDGEWADSRYEAGWSLINWFIGLWDDTEIPRPAINKLKAWIANLYKIGDADVRTSLVTATLEHLFERKDIAKFFSDWRTDPVLGTAYTQAKEWQQKGGKALKSIRKLSE